MARTLTDRQKNILKLLLLIVGAGILCALLSLGFGMFRPASADGSDFSDTATDYLKERETIYVNGVAYTRRPDVSTVLFIGLDAKGELKSNGSYNNDVQADVLTLAVFDQKNKKYALLHLNRDTMTDVQVLDWNGQPTRTLREQIALAHTYGDGMETSCKNTVDAVENLLYGVDVDHYIALTRDAVRIFTDGISGVPVTMDRDWTEIDSRLIKGAAVTMDGDLLVKFTQSRGGLEDSTNESRMERQKTIFRALVETLRTAKISHAQYVDIFDDMAPYMLSNCTVTEFLNLADPVVAAEFTGVIIPKGEARLGAEFMEFYVDEADLQQTVIDLFYDLSDDPQE